MIRKTTARQRPSEQPAEEQRRTDADACAACGEPRDRRRRHRGSRPDGTDPRTRPAVACDIGAVQYFKPAPQLKITKVRPKVLKLKRGRKARSVSVTVSSAGAPALKTTLCLKAKGNAKKSLRIKGRPCRKVGKLAGTRSVRFRVSAKRTAKAKAFRLKAVLSATGANEKSKPVRVKVR